MQNKLTLLNFVKWQDMDKCLDEIFLRTVVDDTSSDLVYHVPGKRNDSASNRLDSIDCNRLFKLTKVKDRFSSSDRLGYRDICLNLEASISQPWIPITYPLFPFQDWLLLVPSCRLAGLSRAKWTTSNSTLFLWVCGDPMPCECIYARYNWSSKAPMRWKPQEVTIHL